MEEIQAYRKIWVTTGRAATSVNYPVNIRKVKSPADILVVTITHEKLPSFKVICKFRGSDILKRKSLGFQVGYINDRPEIKWYSTQPFSTYTEL